ncbi:hypothetical protein [Ralstonia phage RP13]|nr:hypothetical protein [Ralstonia phage RP13]
MSDIANVDLKTPGTVGELRGLNLTNLKASEVGLSLLLLKIAQREAARVTKLSEVIQLLEDKIFDISLFEHLSPQEQMERYQLALQASTQSTSYIKEAIRTVNWSEIETKIMILAQQDQEGSAQLSENAGDLQAAALKLLSQMSSGS